MDGNTLKGRLSDCGMNFNVNTKTAACDLSRHQEGGVSRFEVQFIPTSEPYQLESGLQKNGGLPVRVAKAHTWAWALAITNTSKIIDHWLPKYGRFTKLYTVWTWFLNSRLSIFTVLIPLRDNVNRSSVLNAPAGIHHSGLLRLLSGFYSAPHRMAKHSTSSWQSHQHPVPSSPLHSTAMPKESQLFIYNLLWKSPSSSLW